MSGSSRVKDPVGGDTYIGILVNEALDLRIGIWVIPSNVLFWPFSLIISDRLVQLLKLGALMPTMSIGFRRLVFSIPGASLSFEEELGSLKYEEGPGLEELELEDLDPIFDF
jgi:hypothetical protein